MDDRDLEARLRTHLHRRLDGAQPPPELIASVQQVIDTPPRRIGLPRLGAGSLRPGWSLVAVALGVAVLAVAGLRFGGLLGPGKESPTSTQYPSVGPPAWRQFVVLAPSAELPAKTQSGRAHDILHARLKAMGETYFGSETWTFMSSAGNLLQFDFPPGPSDATIRAVLGATGDVEFVPLPAERYGEGGPNVAEIGDPLPTDEPALFGWDGIESVERRTDEQGRPTIVVKLRPAAVASFASYTETHIGETFAIVIDGEVALLPVINAPILGGEVAVSAGTVSGAEEDRFLRALAILVGGRLPPSWESPVVPEILQQDRITADVLRELPSATVESAGLDAIQQGTGWTAVWRIQLGGDLPHFCPMLPADGSGFCPTIQGSVTSIFDAVTGELISGEPS